MTLRPPSAPIRLLLAGLIGGLALTSVPAGPASAVENASADYPKVTMIINQLTPYLEQKLDKGEVVVMCKQRHPLYDLDVYGNVDGTPEQVWSAVTAYDRYQEFLPLVTTSAIRRKAGNTTYQYVEMDPPWPFHNQWFVNANTEYKAAGRVAFEETEGNVRFERGFWAITSQPGNKTRLQYHLTVDPWMVTMPGWVVEMVTKTIMPNVINGVRKRVRQSR